MKRNSNATTESHADESVTLPGGVSRMSRRAVLRAGTIGAAAIGTISAFPGLLSGLSADAPEVTGAESEGASLAEVSASDTGPIVAHIKDVSSGDMALYVGEREIPYRDPALVRQLLKAAR